MLSDSSELGLFPIIETTNQEQEPDSHANYIITSS